MNQETFDTIVEGCIRDMRVILSVKAKEYARTDRLHNFKRAAAMLACTPATALIGMKAKHDISVLDMVDDVEAGALPTEAFVNEKIGDSINYLVLLKAILLEKIRGSVIGVAIGDSTHGVVEVAIGKKPNRRKR